MTGLVFAGAVVVGFALVTLAGIRRALERIADAQEMVAGAVCLEHAQRAGLLLRVPDAPPEDL